MARSGAVILWDDEEMDVFDFFLQIMGYDFENCDVVAVQLGICAIPRERVEKFLAELIKLVYKRGSRRAGWFALGYLILVTGVGIPDYLKSDILNNTRWSDEKDMWVNPTFALKRKICITDFQEKIQAAREGIPLHPVAYEYGEDELDFLSCGLNQFQAHIKEGALDKIKHLNLDGWALPEIPKEVFSMPWLSSLSLEHNMINELPKELFKLTSLKFLSLNNNKLKEIPEEIANLKALEYLSIAFNNLESLPESIAKLRYLQDLGIENNNIAELPETIKNLKNLKQIYIRGTKIMTLPSFLSNARFDNLTNTIYL